MANLRRSQGVELRRALRNQEIDVIMQHLKEKQGLVDESVLITRDEALAELQQLKLAHRHLQAYVSHLLKSHLGVACCKHEACCHVTVVEHCSPPSCNSTLRSLPGMSGDSSCIHATLLCMQSCDSQVRDKPHLGIYKFHQTSALYQTCQQSTKLPCR